MSADWVPMGAPPRFTDSAKAWKLHGSLLPKPSGWLPNAG